MMENMMYASKAVNEPFGNQPMNLPESRHHDSAELQQSIDQLEALDLAGVDMNLLNSIAVPLELPVFRSLDFARYQTTMNAAETPSSLAIESSFFRNTPFDTRYDKVEPVNSEMPVLSRLTSTPLPMHDLKQPAKRSRQSDQRTVALMQEQQRNIQQRPLKACPEYVERNTSFKSYASPQIILQRCACALQAQDADITFNPLKHKIKGVVYIQNKPVSFVVRVFAARHDSAFATSPSDAKGDHTAPQQYVVEFQKRSGCAVAFNALYRTVISELDDIWHCKYDDWSLSSKSAQTDNESSSSTARISQLTTYVRSESVIDSDSDSDDEDVVSLSPRSRFNASDFARLSAEDTATLNADVPVGQIGITELKDGTLRSLLNMAVSDDDQSRRQSLSALCGLDPRIIVKALHKKNCSLDNSCDASMHALINTISSSLDGKDPVSTRSAAVLLANLTEQQTFCSHVLEDDHIVSHNSVSALGGKHDHGMLLERMFELLACAPCFNKSCDRRNCSGHKRFSALYLRDVKRHIAKAVAQIAHYDPNTMLALMMDVASSCRAVLNYRTVLQNYLNTRTADERLQPFALTALDKLSSLGDCSPEPLYVSQDVLDELGCMGDEIDSDLSS